MGTALPCAVRYHVTCVRVGLPFQTRHRTGANLCFPRVTEWPGFICEHCTVRAILDRELRTVKDIRLVALERMRLIDVAHSWSAGTHAAYQQKLRSIRTFENKFDVNILHTSSISSPPRSSLIPLMWLQESESLQPGRSKRGEPAGTISFGTLRQYRSAVSHFHTIDSITSRPDSHYLDKQNRLIEQPVRPTDALLATSFASGLSVRLGTAQTGSIALTQEHIMFLDRDLDLRYRRATRSAERRLVSLAAVANLFLWLGWLRSSEVFSLRWSDVTVIDPTQGPLHGLPPNCGALLLDLLPETKSSRSQTADVVIAFATVGGCFPGRWFQRALTACHVPSPAPEQLIFQHLSGEPWTSLYFRHTFLYPALHTLQSHGVPSLRPYDHTPGNQIEDKFWSLHSYRRGARTHVSRPSVASRYRATKEQIYAHGRWRLANSGQPIDYVYLDFKLPIRIRLTKDCM